MHCPHLLKALEIAGGRSALRLFYGVTLGIENLGEPGPLSSAQILEVLELDPADEEESLSLIGGHSFELFEQGAIGFRLVREFLGERWERPDQLDFGNEADDGAQMLEWMKSDSFQDWLNKMGIDPDHARLFLEQERHSKPRVFSLYKLYRELHHRGAVALCYWHHGASFPRFSFGPHNQWERLSRLNPREILREGLRQPRYQADFRWAVSAYQEAATPDTPFWPEVADCCRRLGVVPQLMHVVWCAAQQIPHPEREKLQAALRPEIWGRLPESPLTLLEGHLVSAGRVLLKPEDAYHRAESLIGLGRVNRWIGRPEGRLRVLACDGAVQRIELEPG